MKASAILLLSLLLHTAVEAEEKKMIQADTETIGKILRSDREKIRVKVINQNNFAIDVLLLDGVLERKRKDHWEDLRVGFRDLERGLKDRRKRFQRVAAGESVETEFHLGFTHELGEWTQNDTIRLSVIYWPAGKEKVSINMRIGYTEAYSSAAQPALEPKSEDGNQPSPGANDPPQ